MALEELLAPAPDRLAAKLQMAGPLGSDDREALRSLYADMRCVEPHRDIISEGDAPQYVHLIVEGWAARYKLVPDGGRQITAFLIPGDFCDAHVPILGRMDHGIAALTAARIAFIAHDAIVALPLERPRLARALWWATLVDEAILRDWIVNIGRRDAYAGIAHLICELHARLRNVGLADDGRFALPLTQDVIADALGLTSVHVNRILQRLRSEDLIVLRGGTLDIIDPPGLRRTAGFDEAYLHAQSRGD
jgi:CRP-like cAMP-binding protein